MRALTVLDQFIRIAGKWGIESASNRAPSFVCCMCGCDLRGACDSERVPGALLRLQHSHSLILNHAVDPPHSESTASYFNALAQILGLITSTRPRAYRFRKLLSEASGVSISDIAPKEKFPIHFDAFPVDERAKVLQTVAWLFDDWPARFRSLIILGKLRTSDLRYQLVEAPEWFSTAIRRPMRYRPSLLAWRRPFRGSPKSVLADDGFQ
jgi:hypothetical protein